MKILLVDDDSLDVFIAKTLLQSEFQVEGFTSVSEAVAWARDNTFDAALIDYYLGPGVNAIHALNALREASVQPFAYAFVLSSYVDMNQLAQLKSAGFHGVMDKPISLEVVRTNLRTNDQK